ncbi:MAG: class I SAM-dependent methyltransferase [Candidatus Nitronauta litoralis]|uniref:Class I SAM-dependent methyltransferase n=1 Tax=Candidatus Nitronauta litoralis TaxID=2705533 RepID=A0A7T0G1Q9_9BACT|nr:MAG: class I SAM-dependent methyltransferase [Candidatus Nitronauta litoralis]
MQGSEYQQSLVLPGALKLLDLKKNEKVLDVACGQGVFCRYLNDRGHKVEGLDVSSALIDAARRRSPKSISFHHADAGDPKALKGDSFDAVSCLLAMQNIEHLDPVLKNIKRWLKPSGRFVMVATHPCFRIPRQSHWEFDEIKKTQYRRVDLYSSETEIPIVTPPKNGARGHTTTYHRPLQSYFESLASAGFAVDRLEEWTSGKTSEPGKRAKAENRARQEIPLFLALRAIPVNQEQD